jgi:hypothetical protein
MEEKNKVEKQICSNCNIEKTIDLFYKTYGVYVQKMCKHCVNERNKQRYADRKPPKPPKLRKENTITEKKIVLKMDINERCALTVHFDFIHTKIPLRKFRKLELEPIRNKIKELIENNQEVIDIMNQVFQKKIETLNEKYNIAERLEKS